MRYCCEICGYKSKIPCGYGHAWGGKWTPPKTRWCQGSKHPENLLDQVNAAGIAPSAISQCSSMMEFVSSVMGGRIPEISVKELAVYWQSRLPISSEPNCMEQLEVIASEVIASYMAVLKADRAERIAKVEEAAHQWEMAAPAKITRTYLDQTISAIVQAAKGGSSTDYSPSENHPFTEDPPGSEGCA